MTAFRIGILVLLLCASSLPLAFAAGEKEKAEDVALSVISQLKPEQKARMHDATDETLELSRKLHNYWDTEGNLKALLDERTKLYPKSQQGAARKIMEAILKPADMRELSVQLAARVYTAKELEAMIQYYKQEETKSAEAKKSLFTGLMSRGTEVMAGKNAADMIQKSKN